MMNKYKPTSTSQLYNKYSEYSTLPYHELPVFAGFKKENNNVLLTGAGGFLSLHLIQKMNAMNTASTPFFSHIICLVRSKEKFLANAKRYNIDLDMSKLVFIEKDLNDLTPLDITNLNMPVDLVIHSAAKINCLHTLDFFVQDNVLSSFNLYGICAQASLPLMICSTLSVFASSNLQGEHIPQRITPNSNHQIWGGYAQSKAVCELFAPQNAMIARYGLLCASTIEKIFPEHDFFVDFVKALATYKTIPSSATSSLVDITPVDIAASQTLSILSSMSINRENYSYASTFTASPEQRQSLKEKVFHIASAKPLNSLAFIKFMDLETVSDKEFWQSPNYETLSSIQQHLLQWAYNRYNSQAVYPDILKNIDLFQTTDHDWKPFFKEQIYDYELIKNYIKVITSPVLAEANELSEPVLSSDNTQSSHSSSLAFKK